MILNHLATIYQKTTSQNSERKVTVAYSSYKANVACNIQPLQLIDCQRNGWGLSDLDANSKIMFLKGIDAAGIVEDWLVKWSGNEYLIKGINSWDMPGGAAHVEFKLRPIQGQAYT